VQGIHIYCVKDVPSFVTKLVEYSILALINTDRWFAKPAGHTDSQNLYLCVQIVYCVQTDSHMRRGERGGGREERTPGGGGREGGEGGRFFTCGAETVKNKRHSILTDRFQWCGKV
jgi:hypothetical protein